MSNSRRVPVRNWQQENSGQPVPLRDDSIAAELPVALTYNRVSHVVMMATPSDLEDFAMGFSMTEGIVGSVDDLLEIKAIPRPGGVELAMTIPSTWHDRLATRRRNLAGRTGCGLCGAETIEQALRPPQTVQNSMTTHHKALQRAIAALESNQPLQAETGAAHGAAWCNLDGDIIRLREDVGRHNALDKLIGSLFRDGFDSSSGFVVVSSRASYEMVYKSAAAGIEMVVAVSAPTTLAVEFAERSALTLVGFARPGRHNVYTFRERITDWESS